jgi:5'-phosphate synthase pdxT subunit
MWFIDSIIAGLKRFSSSGKPVWGTCAGCILLSDHVSSIMGGGNNGISARLETVQATTLYGEHHIGGVDINTCRNFFGRQTKSFESACESEVEEFDGFPCVFIRAPAITSVGKKATSLAHIFHGDQKIVVAAKQGNLLVTCFHPELTHDTRIHKYFLSMVIKAIE